MACYGSHKDATIHELLDPLPDLAAAEPQLGRIKLARTRRLTYLVAKHTDGRDTSHTPVAWWRRLADLDPLAAAGLAAEAQVAADDGADVAIMLLHRVVEEFNALGDTAVLVDAAAGIDLRRDEHPPTLNRLASAACTLACTKIGGGGWLTFAGRDRPDLWQRAVALDAGKAAGILSEQVVSAIEGRYGTHGVTQALVAAFAAHSPDPADFRRGSASACWDAAFQVIEHRLPGRTYYDDAEMYELTTAPASRSGTHVALARLAWRPSPCRPATTVAVLLSLPRCCSPLGRLWPRPQPRTCWLLTSVPVPSPGYSPSFGDGLRGGELADDLADQLADLARSDLLSVRALAAEIPSNAGREAPTPPTTAIHPTLTSAVADGSDRGEAMSRDYEAMANLVDTFLGYRLESAGDPPGLRQTAVALAATALESHHLEQLRNPSSNAIPDAYLADEAAIEDALQRAGAGMRVAAAQNGKILDPRFRMCRRPPAG